MFQEGGGVFELLRQNAVAYHDVPCSGGVAAGVGDAAAIDDGEPAAGDAFPGVDHPGGFVPGGIIGMVRAELRGNLLHPDGVEDGRAAHPEPTGLHQLRAHNPFRAFFAFEESAARENGKIPPAGTAVYLFLRSPEADLEGSPRQQGSVNALRGGLLCLRWQLRDAPAHGIGQRGG